MAFKLKYDKSSFPYMGALLGATGMQDSTLGKVLDPMSMLEKKM